MKKLRIISLTFLTIGGIFSTLLFWLLIILKNKISSKMFIYDATYMLLEDVGRLILQFSNIRVYDNMMKKPGLVGSILITISAFLASMYLITNYLRKNSDYKKFGSSLAFFVGIVSVILLSMVVFLAGQPENLNKVLNIFKLGSNFNTGIILLFIGPVLTFIGGVLAIVCYGKFQKTKLLTEDQQNILSTINLKTDKIGARNVIPQKKRLSSDELSAIGKRTPVVNKIVSSTNDLKAKMALLKAKIVRNVLLHEEGGTHLTSTSEEENNGNIHNSNEAMRVEDKEGQYLRTIKDGEKIIDESPAGLLLEKKGNFVQKDDIIKHHDYSLLIFGEGKWSSKENSSLHSSIIIPKSEQNMLLNTTELAERISSAPQPSGKQRINPNARVDSSYYGKVFLGDIDKIWTAGKKYREDIIKKPTTKHSFQSSNLDDNLDDYNENNDKIDYNH
ncbi:MFS transporter [Spiroplasma endosymbiont of Polydrusus formosus]|uniref:MFS transporter n=1 Tax=Spiroplasma endosymbiont of Polydrusus formosus TaxID=3139326 RepID=UPI0035B523E4